MSEDEVAFWVIGFAMMFIISLAIVLAAWGHMWNAMLESAIAGAFVVIWIDVIQRLLKEESK